MRSVLKLLALVPLTASLTACMSQRAELPPTQLAALTPPNAVGGTMPVPPPPPFFPPGPERDREWLKLAPAAQINDPALLRTVIDYPSKEKPGTVIVATAEKRLYLIMADGKAMRYPVSVGKEGASWSGTANVDRKLEWPDWNPPKEMLERKPDLPHRLEGGPLNPIGARALYLAQNGKDTLYRIHGTNEPEKIGQSVSSGCIRMLNEDAMDLYNRVPIGTKVVVL
ncbi:L,D-transpeptidase [Methylobacterium brachythecii]|uniref:Lipoprotein-anchoring transpeptidase ErfK/SrfK n=1 Tax=Methylobacterium brachythecii TaxID=1176177 RepID=A0A7W6F763_9HYPH|nr:lipoprotein-anchoring transpeptidase ErfK/SrfK [Methylobacterium brachythecii]GLS45715.1 hypothetical protein GCM10007884_37060 [Methylobacterium brachythecii]